MKCNLGSDQLETVVILCRFLGSVHSRRTVQVEFISTGLRLTEGETSWDVEIGHCGNTVHYGNTIYRLTIGNKSFEGTDRRTHDGYMVDRWLFDASCHMSRIMKAHCENVPLYVPFFERFRRQVRDLTSYWWQIHLSPWLS